jgi:hypothetical protein
MVARRCNEHGLHPVAAHIARQIEVPERHFISIILAGQEMADELSIQGNPTNFSGIWIGSHGQRADDVHHISMRNVQCQSTSRLGCIWCSYDADGGNKGQEIFVGLTLKRRNGTWTICTAILKWLSVPPLIKWMINGRHSFGTSNSMSGIRVHGWKWLLPRSSYVDAALS